MNLKRIFPFFLILLFSKTVDSQRISPLVCLGEEAWNCNEPSVRIDPINPDLTWVSTNNFRLFQVDAWLQYKHLELKSDLGVYGDLVLYPLISGKMACVHLAKNKDKIRPEWHDRIVFQQNEKGFKKWSTGVGIGFNQGKMQDKPWIYQDHQSKSAYYQRIYVTWTEFDRYESELPQDSSRIRMAWSDDGDHFSEPVTISDLSGNCLDEDETVEGATAVCDQHGQVYVAWAGREKIVMDKSQDGGKTWGKDILVGQCPKGWDLDVPGMMRTNGMPFLSIDSSGTLLLVTAFMDSNRHRVFFTRSRDEGQHWDPFFALQSEKDADYVCPHSCVDPMTNTFYVLYYKIKDLQGELLLSYKRSGEEGFRTIKVSDENFILKDSKKFLGDYIGVDALNNQVAMAWTELRNGHAVVCFRKLKFD